MGVGMLWMELSIVLVCIFVGARLGGIGLGTIASVGLLVLVFIFGLPPGMPPRTVLGMILAVITAAATMQAARGLDYLVMIAEKALSIWPAGITLVAPLIAYVFTFAAGTGHIIYALLPVIAEVSHKAGVRPERPLSISTIASQQAITASPISAATVALLGLLAPHGVHLQSILLIAIPATLLGSLLGALAVMWKGTELKDDPIYQDRLARGFEQPNQRVALADADLMRARGSVIVFMVAVLLVVALGLFPSMRPSYAISLGAEVRIEQVDLAPAIMIVMLAAAGMNTMLFGASPEATVKGSIMNAGVVALISIAGLGWLGSSFFEGNRQFIISGISAIVQEHPSVFAVGLFVLSILLASQATTIITLVPVGIALGLSAPLLIALFPAVNGYFFLPTYPTLLAAISFDQTGTTRIGKCVLNHSFMLPGMVATISSVVLAYLIARIVL